MTEATWIPLAEYSSKYRVSVSTLRRRIKSNKVEFQLEDGKYFLKDLALHQHEFVETKKAPQANNATAQVSATMSDAVEACVEKTSSEATGSSEVESININNMESKVAVGGDYKATVDMLLSEIKKAYKLILQEKEEQIVQLKEEVTDLKTLVRILESENERLKKDNFLENSESDEDWLDI